MSHIFVVILKFCIRTFPIGKPRPLMYMYIHISCSNVWECLGEAYLSRGSNIAAMKAFERATEVHEYITIIINDLLFFFFLPFLSLFS